MLKIEVAAGRGRGITVRLEGQLVGPWVHELLRACEPFLDDRFTLTLDFSRVSFVDREGVALCRRLRRNDATLRNCSPFVQEQINA